MPRAWPLPVTAVTTAACGSVVWRSGGSIGVTIIVKATFGLVHDHPMKEIAPIEIVGEDRHHAPGSSLGLRPAEPGFAPNPGATLAEAMEIAPYLPGAGIVLTGHARAPAGRPVPSMAVRMALFRGEKVLNKALLVTGDRAHANAPSVPVGVVPIGIQAAMKSRC